MLLLSNLQWMKCSKSSSFRILYRDLTQIMLLLLLFWFLVLISYQTRAAITLKVRFHIVPKRLPVGSPQAYKCLLGTLTVFWILKHHLSVNRCFCMFLLTCRFPEAEYIWPLRGTCKQEHCYTHTYAGIWHISVKYPIIGNVIFLHHILVLFISYVN